MAKDRREPKTKPKDAFQTFERLAGKIVRVPMDVLDHPFADGKVEDLDGTPVYSLVSGPDRTLALAAKRAVDIGASLLGLLLLAPVFGLALGFLYQSSLYYSLHAPEGRGRQAGIHEASLDRKSTRLNSSHTDIPRMPSSA